jgi:Skp family chaperone for outer membrane proteins
MLEAIARKLDKTGDGKMRYLRTVAEHRTTNHKCNADTVLQKKWDNRYQDNNKKTVNRNG